MNKTNPAISICGKPLGFCYLISVGGHQKIGQSINVDGVIADARRFDASARLLACWPSTDYKVWEGLLHEGLKQWRVENEQFEMPSEVVQWIASLDDREFGEWVVETDCDVRSIGWKYPRVYLHGKTRMWSCLYVPSNDLVAWAMVGREEKPDYSLLERLWMMDSRGFNSVWLGRPQKNGGVRPIEAYLPNFPKQ